MKLDPITPNEDISVTRFRQYLRIETVQPEPDYVSAKEFLRVGGRPVLLLDKYASD